MNELDERLARIRRQKAEARTSAAEDFAQLNEGLAEAQSKLVELDAAQQTLSDVVEADSRRIASLRRRVTVGVVLAALVGALVLALAGAAASRMLDEARTEADRIRIENAQVIAEAHAEGEVALQALTDRLASREAALSAKIETIGAELAQLAADRDAARTDLEHFIELRRQIGFELIAYRERVVIVVPPGETITRWNAPGLSDLARHNGRMFRVVQAD